MPQPKGHTGNPNGRPKGSPNKTTSTVRSWLVALINDNRAQIEQDFKSLEGKDRLEMLQKLLPYLLPKVQDAGEVEDACYTRDAVVTVGQMWDRHQEVKRWYEQ